MRYKGKVMSLETAPKTVPSALDRVVVVLVQPQGPTNIGLVCRVCVNLGVSELRIVDPRCPIDAPDARKFAMHSTELLHNAQRYDHLAEAIKDCDLAIAASARRHNRRYLPSIEAEQLPSFVSERSPKRFALVLGNEAHGLTQEQILECHACVRLHSRSEQSSFNLSHAVAILLYSLIQTDFGATEQHHQHPGDQPANRAALDGLFDTWLGTLARASYFRRTELARYAPKLQQLIYRLRLRERDVNTLRGMFTQIDRSITIEGSARD